MDLTGAFVFGKKQIMRVYFKLNKSESTLFDKFLDVLDKMKDQTKKYCLFFTNKSLEDIQKVLATYKDQVYIQPGHLPTATLTIEKGNAAFDSISTSNAAFIRNLGCFVLVDNGKLTLDEDYIACKKGQPVEVGQCKILKMLGIKVGKFQAKVIGYML